ncbi:response regulator transcription factor [Effusibacillus lacus]|uniref:DNA-binding response regulator n=1 Tax=Effusibacillus lacus TaxID=1348429 RepID=A0A292YJB9_9BACL|nr:response regulator transcription factor [Effusibacillus lacus]TCS69781.1 LuxR family two component transcriptional regulator [Effusibacillus lacus]GAX88863.1 DNA-binding response regulator [Effusibacillus lacus]
MSPQNPIKIVLADDHTLFRQGLRRIFELEEDFQIIGEATDGEQAVALAGTMTPSVILMDINMPERNGVEATRQIKEMYPAIKVLILSIHDDEAYIFEAIRAGANGYLLKDVESEVLVDAVRQVAGGTAFIHPQVTTKLINEFKRLSYKMGGGRVFQDEIATAVEQDTWQDLLTQREMEILRLMAEGKSNRNIGETLFISEKTVKNHVSSILGKLGVDDRTQAVITAARRGWVRL